MPISEETLDEVEKIAIDISGCREAFDPYNPYRVGPIAQFRRMWPAEQAKWKRRALAILREERKTDG